MTPKEYRRDRFKVIGHIIEGEQARHHLQRVPAGSGPVAPAGDHPAVLTPAASFLPDGAIVEVVGTWEVVP